MPETEATPPLIEEKNYLVDILADGEGEITGETTYRLIIGKIVTNASSDLVLVRTSHELPLGVRVDEDTGYEEVVVHEVNNKNFQIKPRQISPTQHIPLALPHGLRIGAEEYDGTSIYVREASSFEGTYNVPLLDKLIADDDDVLFERSFVEGILRDYALNNGLRDIDRFVEDKLNSLDGVEPGKDEYPGQYL